MTAVNSDGRLRTSQTLRSDATWLRPTQTVKIFKMRREFIITFYSLMFINEAEVAFEQKILIIFWKKEGFYFFLYKLYCFIFLFDVNENDIVKIKNI